jgi:predicted nuclease of predicted toxin-antitoxin system
VIPLLFDMGLPRRAAEDLRRDAWDVVHVGEVGMSRATDLQILESASRDKRVVVTLDADFGSLVATGTAPSVSVVHIRWMRTTREAVVAFIRDRLPSIESDLLRGCIVSVSESSLRVHYYPVR